jgi:hypothetical protein
LRLAVVCGLLIATSAFACQVPVFRYALERWPADKYEIIVLHDGPLGPEDQARLAELRKPSEGTRAAANFQVRTMEVAEVRDRLLADLWRDRAQASGPLMVVLYPRNAQEVPDRIVHVAAFNDESIRHLVDSPVRQQVVEKLLDGDSAVWIFVPSGHAEQDEIAMRTLTEQILLNQQQLELPPIEEIEADEFFRAETNIELRISFSIVTLNRKDPREQYLLKLLLGSESDLEELDEPMAFPVLGRGRVLYALVGKGIARDTIGMASSFIVGPCSCQVKEQNPGFDLLLNASWDEKVGGASLSKPLPQITTEPVLLQIPPGKASR